LIGSSDPPFSASVAQPVHRLLALYLAFATPPLLLPGRPPMWPAWLALHIAVALIAWPPRQLRPVFRRLADHWPHVARLLLDWFPLLLVPAFYSELAQLIPALHGAHYYDALIQQVERQLFSGLPSREFAQALPYRRLSELLHAGYLSFYLVIYVPPILLYATGRQDQARRTIFSVVLAFALHYVIFIYFPVQGPRYLFPAPAGPLADGPIYQLSHWALEHGSSRGAAFPSSHVGVSLAQALTALRFQRRLSPWLALLTLLIALGSVYGGFHYGTDAIAGALLGTAAVLLAPVAYRVLGGSWRSEAARS